MSVSAVACPHCGRPAAGQGKTTVKPKRKKSSALGTLFKAVFLVFSLFLFIGVIGQMSSETRPRAASSSSASSARSLFTTRQANIRSGPGTEHPVVATVAAGQQLQYLDKAGSWYRLSSPDTAQRWVHESIVQTAAQGRASTAAAARKQPSAQLRCGDWSWHNEYGYAVAEGQVTNTTSTSLENVMTVVTFKTDDGTFITTADAVIDYNPILPGQTSPWKVMATWNPAMGNAKVEFKKMFGGTLRTERR